MKFEKIKLNNNFDIKITQYNNLYANSFSSSDSYQWSDWLNRLQIPMINENKYKRGLVLYGDVADSDSYEKYRKDANIIERSVIALDYDVINNFKGLYNAICKQLEGCAWAFHTTYSHTTEKPRIRLMVPINKPVSAEEYRKYAKILATHIGYEVDEASFVPSQAMALPVKRDKDAVFIIRYNDAPAIESDDLEKMVKKYKSINIDSSQKYKKHNSSYWRDVAFGVSEGERNQTLASLIGYLLRRYVDANLVYGIVSAWAMTCTPPIEQKEVNQTFISILKKDKQNKEKGAKK